MKRGLKAGFLTLCMTALATAPVVTITTLATADAAYAKNNSGNSGSNGNGGGNSNAGGNGKGKDKSASARGNSGAKSQGKGKAFGQSRSSSKGGPKTLGEFFQKLTGQDRKASRTTISRGNSAKQTVPATITEAPAKRGAKRIAGMHPSQLGNMNGALNANINAVLAHIRNGNTNGPVGVVAGLAVAKIGAEGQQDILDIESGYVALNDALAASAFSDEADPLAAYLASLDDAKTGAEDPAVEAALADLDTPPDGSTAEELEQALAEALEASPNLTTEDKSLDAYLQTLDDAETAARIDPIDDALVGLSIDDETGEPLERPSTDDIETAGMAVEDLNMAEDAVIETWNKSDAANQEDTDALLEALHMRITDNDAAIRSTVTALEPEMESGEIDDDLVACEDGETCVEGEVEEIASKN